jgi:hypothetical protein
MTKTKLKSITVAELIEALQGEDPEAMVVFASNYGDYHKTQQVHFIGGDLEEQPVEESAYSDSGYAICRPEEGDDEELDGSSFLVLS